MRIDQQYEALLLENTDVKAHLPTLHALATGKRVVEIGTRHGISTRALLAGRPISLTCYDLAMDSNFGDIIEMGVEIGVHVMMSISDINDVKSIPDCDFVFLDAQHNGTAVAHQMELAKAAGASMIASHDTEIFGTRGDDGGPGINVAFNDFLRVNKEWEICHYNPQSYGMTVIKKQTV